VGNLKLSPYDRDGTIAIFECNVNDCCDSEPVIQLKLVSVASHFMFCYGSLKKQKADCSITFPPITVLRVLELGRSYFCHLTVLIVLLFWVFGPANCSVWVLFRNCFIYT